MSELLGFSRAAFERRLAIVVPFRHRHEHLRSFVPHMLRYFERDKLDRHIRYEIHIVEQADDSPFNRGALKNIGFATVRNRCDYVCFHDVDYLPVWSDYSFPEAPTRLIWHGLMASTTDRTRPQGAPSRETFFGGVVMFSNEHFEAIGGYPNCYWGWGAEDTELRMRCKLAGLEPSHRDGTYRALPHEHDGLQRETLAFNEVATRNHRLLAARTATLPQLVREDSYATVAFEHVNSGHLTFSDHEFSHIHVHRVELRYTPPAER
jgi:hypothetical protein